MRIVIMSHQRPPLAQASLSALQYPSPFSFSLSFVRILSSRSPSGLFAPRLQRHSTFVSFSLFLLSTRSHSLPFYATDFILFLLHVLSAVYRRSFLFHLRYSSALLVRSSLPPSTPLLHLVENRCYYLPGLREVEETSFFFLMFLFFYPCIVRFGLLGANRWHAEVETLPTLPLVKCVLSSLIDSFPSSRDCSSKS